MRAPRDSFKLTGHGEAFARLRATVPFETACDYALLELQAQMPPNTTPSLPTDPYVGLDANAQMFGARRVIEILKALGDPDKPRDTTPRPTLHYNQPKP